MKRIHIRRMVVLAGLIGSAAILPARAPQPPTGCAGGWIVLDRMLNEGETDKAGDAMVCGSVTENGKRYVFKRTFESADPNGQDGQKHGIMFVYIWKCPVPDPVPPQPAQPNGGNGNAAGKTDKPDGHKTIALPAGSAAKPPQPVPPKR
jgi:hypothetical protein